MSKTSSVGKLLQARPLILCCEVRKVKRTHAPDDFSLQVKCAKNTQLNVRYASTLKFECWRREVSLLVVRRRSDRPYSFVTFIFLSVYLVNLSASTLKLHNPILNVTKCHATTYNHFIYSHVSCLHRK